MKQPPQPQKDSPQASVQKQRCYRVGIISIKQESNTFASGTSDLEKFYADDYIVAEAIRAAYKNSHHEVGGFFGGLEAADIEAVPLLMAYTAPAGPVTDRALDALWQAVEEALDAAGSLDGVLAAPHGAGVNVSRHDMDGWWLTRLRQKLGASVPLIASCDPHGNLTPAMVSACDAIVAYRENPHIDMRQRGEECAALMARTLRGEITPRTAAVYPAVMINIERQFTFEEPVLSLKRKLEEVRQRPGVLSASLFLGYPYADVAEMGSAFAVTTDGDAAQAEAIAQELGAYLENTRERFVGEMISPEQALEQAKTLPKPVGLLDMGDNMGGGAPADSTVLAHLFHLRSAEAGRTFICLADPQSVEQARAAGVGARVRLRMGGKDCVSPAAPLEAEVTVRSLHDGRYRETQPRHGGRVAFDMGPTAVVQTDFGLTVMLSSRPSSPASLQQLLSCDVDPLAFDLIVLKGVHAPIGAYRDVCRSFIRVNTPGVTTADMLSLDYKHRRRPLFPFER